ncbi:MAG: exodeoxyribonuclease V subunit gamma [Cyanobacteriota bacterium]
MLTVFRSNRAEFLARILAQSLALAPPDPFSEVAVVVNTWPTSRWLGEQLALNLGICGHLRFPFPGACLRRVVNELLGEDGSEEATAADPWRAQNLVWAVLQELPALTQEPEAAALRHWLDGHDPTRRIDRSTWQLARAIADALDDYTLYRPSMVMAWWQGEDHDGFGLPLPQSQGWQPLLLRRLARRLVVQPFGLKVLATIDRLLSGTIPDCHSEEPLRLFGLSSMAPVQIQLLQAIASVRSVELYLLTPCRDLWQRCIDRRRQLQDSLALHQPLDLEWLLAAPPLEARFGRLGGEFQQLLEGTGEVTLGGWQERDLFFAAAAVARETHPEHRPPLLAQLQQQLVDSEAWPELERCHGDSSLEFHACSGLLRQAQVVRDRVLQLLAADPTLAPRDILVMTPQVDRFAPVLASVFGDGAATGVALPWRLTDRSQQGEAALSRTILILLNLAGTRLTASSLDPLLESPSLRRRFQLQGDAGQRISETLQRCGFRWGLDAVDRAGDPTHSLSWAIDRLLLGLVLPEHPGLAIGSCAPQAPTGSFSDGGRVLHLLTWLRRWLRQLRQPRDCQAWGLELRRLLEALGPDPETGDWERQELLAAIEAWQLSAAGSEALLEAPVVAAVLEERLAVDSGRFGHRSGSLTISALEPMRAIPHRVVVLMGLDAELFPRRQTRPGFHLMERRRQLGDPQPADQDRYVLLEALLSARDHLLITWSCRDPRSGDPLPPATPVRQWLELLQASLGPGALDGLLVEHATNPLERSNFLPLPERPPPSCDQRLLQARRLIERERSDHGEVPALAFGPMPVEADVTSRPVADPYDDLRRWLIDPQEHWLAGLGLRAREWSSERLDLEALSLDERQRSALLRERLAAVDQLVTSGPPQVGGDDDDDGGAAWIDLSRGRGLLPARSGGLLEASLLQRRWQSLKDCLRDLGGSSRLEPCRWRQLEAPLRWQGTTLLLLHTARGQARHVLELWLQLLLAVAADQAPDRAVLLARDGERFGICATLQPPALPQAEAELERLLDLLERWRRRCWPLPPRTALAYAQRERERPVTGLDRAIQVWEGGFKVRGERDQEAQALCFGSLLPGRVLLQEQRLAMAEELLAPLLEHLTWTA